jgi:hypothetical protein
MWRVATAARVDFSGGSLRLDMKTTSGRVRRHTLSYEQCNPPEETVGMIASTFTERVGAGTSVGYIVEELLLMLQGRPDLQMKVREQVAEALGDTMAEALEVQYDLAVSTSGLRFYLCDAVPAIRGVLDPALSEVHFTSDFSLIPHLTSDQLVEACFEGKTLIRRQQRS